MSVIRRKNMKKKLATMAIKSFALVVVLCSGHQAMAQDATLLYPKMAPVDQYLMSDKNAEIALARSAAPDSIARDADVLVLGRHGFETAVKGENGFVCIEHHQDHRTGLVGTHAS
jgi:hypothetical protein